MKMYQHTCLLADIVFLYLSLVLRFHFLALLCLHAGLVNCNGAILYKNQTINYRQARLLDFN